jgi:hypothetical protein
METVESITLGLDFVNDLDDGEFLTSSTWFLTVIQGVDATPSSHLSGTASLVTPAGTTRITATQQRITGLLANVTYTAEAVVITSLGNTKSLWAHVRGEPIE